MNKKMRRGWSRRCWVVLTLGLGAAMPALAQEEPPPVEEAAPAEVAAPAEEVAPAEEAAPDEDAAPTEESVAGDESGSSEEAGGESDGSSGGESGSEGLPLYVGVEFAQTRIEVNDDALRAAFGSRRFDSDFYKLRLGARVLDGVGVEFQGGIPGSDSGNKKLETSQYYGLFLVPTGVAFETVEISARIGYSLISIENDTADEDIDGMSFSLALELPIRRFAEGLPDLRLTAAGDVYQGDREARVYGYSVGLRYDFRL